LRERGRAFTVLVERGERELSQFLLREGRELSQFGLRERGESCCRLGLKGEERSN